MPTAFTGGDVGVAGISSPASVDSWIVVCICFGLAVLHYAALVLFPKFIEETSSSQHKLQLPAWRLDLAHLSPYIPSE